MIAHLAAGDVAPASEAAEAAWSHVGGLQGQLSPTAYSSPRPRWARGDLAEAPTQGGRCHRGDVRLELAWALTTRARVAIAEGDPERAERMPMMRSHARGTAPCFWAVRTSWKSSPVWPAAGSHREGARLFGAADGMRGRTGEVRFQIYQAGYENRWQRLRNSMDEDDFEAAWAEGAAMSNEEAFAYAQRGRGERKRPASGWTSLTPTERDVVRLVRRDWPIKTSPQGFSCPHARWRHTSPTSTRSAASAPESSLPKKRHVAPER